MDSLFSGQQTTQNMHLWSPRWQGMSFESHLKAKSESMSPATTLEQLFKLSLALPPAPNSSGQVLSMAPPSSFLSSWAPARRGQRLAFGEALLGYLVYTCHSCYLPTHSSLYTKRVLENPNLLCYSQTPTRSTWSGLVWPLCMTPVSMLRPAPATQALFSAFRLPCSLPS